MLYTDEQIAESADRFIEETFHGNPEEAVQYYLVNQDLKMGKGKVAAQVAHAATINCFRIMEFRNRYHRKNYKLFLEWYHSIMKKIILKAPQELMEKYEALGYIAIRDKGYTQIAPDSLTVVCLGVMRRKDVPQEIQNLSLL
jgi:peptidyl-tRNA hydrolase